MSNDRVATRESKGYISKSERAIERESKAPKEERHGEHDKSISVILSFITNTSLAIIWKVFPGYMSFIESPTKRRKCKEVVFYVTFMPS